MFNRKFDVHASLTTSLYLFCCTDKKEDNSTSGYEVIERTDSNLDYSSLDVYDTLSNFNQEMIQPDGATGALNCVITSGCSPPLSLLHAERPLDTSVADFQLQQTNKVPNTEYKAKASYRKTPLPSRKVMSISGSSCDIDIHKPNPSLNVETV